MIALNRNHYFVIGIVLLLLGLQFRFVESYSLTPETSEFIAERFEEPEGWSATLPNLLAITTPDSRKIINTPRWLGYALLSIGAIVSLHSMAMKKPE